MEQWRTLHSWVALTAVENMYHKLRHKSMSIPRDIDIVSSKGYVFSVTTGCPYPPPHHLIRSPLQCSLSIPNGNIYLSTTPRTYWSMSQRSSNSVDIFLEWRLWQDCGDVVIPSCDIEAVGAAGAGETCGAMCVRGACGYVRVCPRSVRRGFCPCVSCCQMLDSWIGFQKVWFSRRSGLLDAFLAPAGSFFRRRRAEREARAAGES